VCFTGNRGFQIVRGSADRQTRCRITNLFQVLKMAMSMAGFAFSRGTKNGSDIVVTFDIGLGGKIQITAVGL